MVCLTDDSLKFIFRISNTHHFNVFKKLMQILNTKINSHMSTDAVCNPKIGCCVT